jgi:hypothetical protein
MLYTGVRVPKAVKPKKRCCRSGPRCKRCPVVCKRLAKQGLATKKSNGTFVLQAGKKALKSARA